MSGAREVRHHLLLSLAVRLLAAMWVPQEAMAFARKYKTVCSTYHVVIPKLNDFGEAFRLKGFKIPPDEFLVKDESVALGPRRTRTPAPRSSSLHGVAQNVPVVASCWCAIC